MFSITFVRSLRVKCLDPTVFFPPFPLFPVQALACILAVKWPHHCLITNFCVTWVSQVTSVSHSLRGLDWMFCKVLSNAKECLSIYPTPKPQIAFHNILTHLCHFKTARVQTPGSQREEKNGNRRRARAEGPSLPYCPAGSYCSSHISASFRWQLCFCIYCMDLSCP